MGKFTGYKCDNCNNAEDGNDRPMGWLVLSLPANGNGTRESKDFCGDRCLVKFARERAGMVSASGTRKSRTKDDALLAFLTDKGIVASRRGGIIGSHVRRRHEVAGAEGDCLVCEFMTTKEAV